MGLERTCAPFANYFSMVYYRGERIPADLEVIVPDHGEEQSVTQPFTQPIDRIVCINLDQRADRWQCVQLQLAHASWPFGSVERFSAIDGQKVPPPMWWRAGAGAWGCYQSHVAEMRRAIQDDVKSLLILEDDAVLSESFASHAQAFLAAVPRFHVDPQLGMLHKQFRVYAPDIWLIGPGSSGSDRVDVQRGERFWSLEPEMAVAR